MRGRWCWALLLASAALPAIAGAQPFVPPVAPPQGNPVDQAAPRVAPRLQPRLEQPPPVPQTGPGAGLEVTIAGVRVTGNEAVPESGLATALAGLAGATIPLARLEEARLEILVAYRTAGYPFAAVDAGLTRRPDGTADLTFAVTEGFVAEVKLDGDPEAIGPAGNQVLGFLERLVGVRPVSSAALERALLLASDIPGLTVRATLRPLPGQPGGLLLVAQVERKRVSGYVNVDNRGYKLVGPWQGLLVAGANSYTRFGERTEISVFAAPDNAQTFGQASLESFIGTSGLRVRIYAGMGDTRPTGALQKIGYYGQTQLGGATANYPIIRSRPFNLYAVGSFDAFDSTVETGTNGRTRASRDAIRTLRFGTDAQLLEAWLPLMPAAATTTTSLRVSHGLTAFGATRTGYPLSGRSGSENFGYTKLGGELQRTQPVLVPFEGALLSLQALVAGQWTNAILPQAEKFYLGGNRLGRGYYSGQVTGDSAWGAAFELQLDLTADDPIDPGLSDWVGGLLNPGTAAFIRPVLGPYRLTPQFYVFRDIGRTFENRDADPNRRVSSWGGGVRMVINEAVQFDIEGVHRVVRRPDGASADPLRETALIFRTLVRF